MYQEKSTIPQKIALVGCSGAGKTTFGRKWQQRYGGVFLEIDSLLHKPNWVQASREELYEGVSSVIDGESRWIVDNVCEKNLGNYLIDQVDVIIWLDLPLWLKLGRVFRRSWQRITQNEVLWNGNRETWRGAFWGKDSVVGFAILKHFRLRRTMPHKPYASRVVHLRSPKEVESFLSVGVRGVGVLE